jgi:FlaA1/EpsC-like NDP-sugar epimerase
MFGARQLARLRRGRRRKRASQIAIDCSLWVAALFLAALLRFDFDPGRIRYSGLLLLIPFVWIVQVVAGHVMGLYRGRWIFGSFEELAAVGVTVLVTGTLLVLVDVPFRLGDERPAPVSVLVAGTIFAFLLMGAIRYAWRLVTERRRVPNHNAERAIVFGAGEAAREIIRAVQRDPKSPYRPVAVLDDDPELRGLTIHGVRVIGDRSTLGAVRQRFGAHIMLVAVPSAPASLVRELLELADPAGVDVRILPSVGELLGKAVRPGDFRPPDERDLLGRHQIETDLNEIAGYLTGKRVLVTGAGGSIGAELCRQIHAFAPSELILVDRDESALHAVQLLLEGRALLDSPNLALCEIRDRDRVRELFCTRRPDVVFHAAALKHLPLLEANAVEALKTNVWGTLSVLEAALAAEVSTFVNISTDKAANPCSVLGYSKRLAEGLTSWFGGEAAGRYLSVRFGNVLGSRGSVLNAFRSQIEAGGPLTVTDPRVTRFFMTVEEAVQLVVQAGAIGAPQEALVLDMGDPVSIAEVAQRLAGLSERPIRIEYTGLRQGEKLHEELFAPHEEPRPSEHRLISAVEVPPLDPTLVRRIDPAVANDLIAGTMQKLCAHMDGTRNLVPLDFEFDPEIDAEYARRLDPGDPLSISA